jgi:hypothetical protein
MSSPVIKVTAWVSRGDVSIPLADLKRTIAEVVAATPKSLRGTLKFSATAETEWDDSAAVLSISYTRPETKDERGRRVVAEKRAAAAYEMAKRELYEELRKEYGDQNAKF